MATRTRNKRDRSCSTMGFVHLSGAVAGSWQFTERAQDGWMQAHAWTVEYPDQCQQRAYGGVCASGSGAAHLSLLVWSLGDRADRSDRARHGGCGPRVKHARTTLKPGCYGRGGRCLYRERNQRSGRVGHESKSTSRRAWMTPPPLAAMDEICRKRGVRGGAPRRNSSCYVLLH